jgi:hypothetical protein
MKSRERQAPPVETSIVVKTGGPRLAPGRSTSALYSDNGWSKHRCLGLAGRHVGRGFAFTDVVVARAAFGRSRVRRATSLVENPRHATRVRACARASSTRNRVAGTSP